MVKKIFGVILSAILLVAFSACGGGGGSTSNGDGGGTELDIFDYFPLVAGYSWSYNRIGGGFAGTMRVGQSDFISGIATNRIEDISDTSHFTNWAVTNDGLFQWAHSDSGGITFNLNPIKYANRHPKVGDLCQSIISGYSVSTKFEARETISLANFPNIDCIKISLTTSDGGSYMLWYGKGIGLVKSFQNSASTNLMIFPPSMELVSKNF